MKRIVKNKSSENKVKGRPYVSLPRDIQKGADLWTSISRKGMGSNFPPASLELSRCTPVMAGARGRKAWRRNEREENGR
jgi:hypothetical protein